MNFIRQIFGFLSALLISLPLMGNASLSDMRFESTELVLPAINKIQYTAERFSGIDLGNGSFSWVGKIRGGRSDFVSLAVMNGESTLTVSFADGITYSGRGELENLILTRHNTRHKVCGGCVASGDLPPDPRRMRAQPMLSWQNGDANLIDLLVVYPAVVRTDAGGTSAIQAEIMKAVADTNLCYQNSRVNVQLRLVHMEEVSYTPTGLLDTDLTRLKGMNDGYMDNVHTLRDNNGADLVALLTTESDSGGLASTLSHPSLNFESSGFSVNVWTQISAPSYTLAHEIGHNMGCLHNIEDSSGVTPLYDFGAFSYGKRWFSSGQGVKTVMSYDTKPSSTYPTTIPYFSNPSVIYEGTQTGNQGSADNALVLSSTAPYVSNFRVSVIQGILPETFDLEMEEGNYSNLSVRMSAKPIVPIQVVLSVSGDPDIMLTSGNILNFDSTNWNLPHPVQIYAKQDSDTISDTATLILSSNGLPSVSVALNEVDNSSNPVSGFLFSGVVVNELGVGLEGVSITLSNGGGQTWTDQDGAFLLEISSNWSGAITFLRDGYSFSPSGLNLGLVSSDLIGHSIEATRSDILFVNASATGAGDGTSWGNAYTDLGDALRSTTPFNEVWVASGTYKAGLVRSSFFLIPPGIEVYGGFSGNEISRNSRNIEAHPVVLSGDLGILNNNSDNAFHVVVPSNGSVLDGFTITGGNASENFNDDDRGKGAGLWADSSNFTVSNCTFVSNHSYQGGSALYFKDVNSTILNCEFNSNTTGSTGSGGAIYLEDSNVTFSNTSFLNNHSDYHAGAIKSENSDLNLISCTFSSNRSLTSNGAGAVYMLGGNYLIRSTLFESNQATFQGGAILISNSSGVIEDSNFTGNQNTQLNGGGALYIENCSPIISRCNFSENITMANNNGGAIKLINSSPQITDSSFIRNQSQVNSAGAISLDSTSIPILSNNRFQFNSAAQFGGAIFVNGSDLSIDGGLLQGNSANYGGAIATQGSVAINIQNIRALGNEANSSASANAGFVYLNSGVTSSIFVNCEISGNKSASRYGVYRPSGATKFVNCTLVGNTAATDGGITLMFSGDSIEFNNCIVWNNSAGTANDIWVNSGSANANYSLFISSESLGTISGSNNLSGNPLFIDADGVDNIFGTLDDDLRLQPGSPAIDQASTALANYPIADLNSSLRAGEPDIGAYEYWPVPYSFVYNGAQYEIIKQSATWTEAVNIAVSKGGKLAEITDIQEQNAIFSELANASINPSDTIAPDGGGGAYLWIGGNDMASESTWIWNGDNDQDSNSFWSGNSNGSPFSGSFHNWGSLQSLQNEPDDYQGQQDALAISIDGWPLGTAGQWNDINENNTLFFVIEFNGVPTITSASSFSVAENETNVGMVTATDPNGDELLFHISGGNDQDHFMMNSATGLISFISSSDFENPSDSDGNNTYEINIEVSDGKAQVNQSIIIHVLDVNESEPPIPQLPAFEFNATLLEIPEDAPIGSPVGHIYRVSGDLNQSVIFSLEQNGTLPVSFSVEANGTIFVAGSLDYEDRASHTIHVRGMEGNRTDIRPFIIHVLDVNESDEVPIDGNESGYGVGPEFTLDTRDPTTDPSGGGGGEDPVDRNESGYGVGPEFTLDTRDPTTDPPVGGGVVDPIDGNESGYGVGPEFTLDTRDPTTDLPGGGGGEDPIDGNESGYGVGPEFTLDTRDPSTDQPGGGGGEDPVDGNESGYGVGPEFTLDTRDPSTDQPGGGGGEDPVDGNESGYGVGPEFTLDTRDEFDDADLFDFNASVFEVFEDALIGTEVGHVYHSRRDMNDSVSFDLVLNPTSPPLPFRLESNGSLITVAELDFEENSSYLIEIRGWTSEGESAIHSFPVSVLDVYEEAFDFNASTLAISEDALIGTEVGYIYQSYGDFNDSVSFDLVHDPESPPLPFRLESNGSLLTIAELDFEENASYRIEVRGWTSEGEFAFHSFHVSVLDVYEEAFDFNASVLEVFEDAPLGTEVGYIYQSYGDFNTDVTFDLVLKTTSPPLPFRLESNGSLITVAELDFEENASYPIEIRGWTREGESTIHSFTILVVDVYEEAFDFNASVLEVFEDAPLGTEVGHIYHSYGDFNDSVSFDLVHDPASPPLPFRLESNGSLITVAELDFEENASYPIEVRGWTSEGEFAFHSFTILVVDVYEEAFDFNASLLKVFEDAPLGTEVGYIYQSHGDFNEGVGFDLIHDPASPPSPFRLESNGSLLTVAELDFEENASYPIEVRGWTREGESNFHVFMVSVLDVYEEVYDFNASALEVSEDAPIGTEVGYMYQSHGDGNLSVSYELINDLNTPSLPFRMEANGSLVVIEELNFQQNPFYLIKVLGMVGNTRVIKDFRVSVLHEYQFLAGLFDFNSTKLEILENAPAGSLVGQMYQINGNLDLNMSYRIQLDSNFSDIPFLMDSSGLLLSSEILDYEANSNYSIQVIASSDNIDRQTRVFEIVVLDLDETPFDFNSSTLEASEDAPLGTEVGHVYQSRGDINDSVSFDLVHDPASPPLPFRLESNGSLITFAELDFEENASYPIGIRGWTSGGESAFHLFTISVIDVYEEAFDFNAIVFEVSEDAPVGTEVGYIYQSHGDVNDSVSFDLVHDPISPPLPFRLESNGSLITVAELDFEKNASYSIEIRGWTSEGESAIHSFPVSVLDVYEEAFDFNASALAISEDALIGTEVGYIYQSHGDFNDSVSFDLVHNPASSPLPFRLESNGSLITVAELDFEENASYRIEIRGSTSEGESAFHTFTILVVDVYEEAFDFNASVLEVFEDAPLGTEVGYIYQSHGDFNESVGFDLIHDPASPPLPFRLESNGSLLTIAELDFEENASYPIEIRGWTREGESNFHVFMVSVLDVYEEDHPVNNSPHSLSSSDNLSVKENEPTGTIVGHLSAIDPDANATLNYSLFDQNESTFNFWFNLDSNGTLRTAGSFDYEIKSTYLIRVRAYDEFGAFTESTFNVQILDILETSPFDFNATILQVSENASVGTAIGQMYQSAGEQNTSVVYSLNYDSAINPIPFQIDENGILYTDETLDYETYSTYLLKVNAIGDGFNVTHQFQVQVMDRNDPPNFVLNNELIRNSDFTFSFTESTPPVETGTPSVWITSADILNNGGRITIDLNGGMAGERYLIKLGDETFFDSGPNWRTAGTAQKFDYDRFVIDFSAGLPTSFRFIPLSNGNSESFLLGEKLPVDSNFDNKAYYLEAFGLVDDGSPTGMANFLGKALSNLGQVSTSMAVFNSNLLSIVVESSTLFQMTGKYQSAMPPTYVPENHVFAIDLNATDSNADDLIYSIEPGGDGSSFSINPLTGILSFKSPPDYERDFSVQGDSHFEVIVSVSDGEFKSTLLVPIILEDINEIKNDSFDFNSTSLIVEENVPYGTVVGSVYRINGDFTQSITFNLDQNNLDNLPLSVERNGTILVVGSLDYEQNSSHLLKIRGTEGNQSVTRHFEVQVLDVFEMDMNSAPTDILIQSEELKVKGNQDTGTVVGSLYAVDFDLNDQHSFILVEGSGSFDNSYFNIEVNGTLRTSSVLDFGLDKNLSIRVEVADSKGATYQKVFEVFYKHEQAGEDVILLSEGADIVPGWKRAGWFGFYFADFYPWVYHENLGWIFVSEKTMDGAWFFRDRLGWVWTSPEVFPALFQYEQNKWTYLETTNPWTILFDYDRMEWFELDRDYEISGLSQPASSGYVKGFGFYQRGQVASIEAVSSSSYIFKGWGGDLSGEDPILNFEVYSDLKIVALFEPIITEDSSPEEIVGNAVEAINSIEGLTPELKQKALAELLLTGESSTAGIKSRGE